jgi:hypothetical protein
MNKNFGFDKKYERSLVLGIHKDWKSYNSGSIFIQKRERGKRGVYCFGSSFFSGLAGFTYVIAMISTPRAVTGAVYWVSMERHFTGQVSTHELQTIHRSRSICHVFASLLMRIACAGHFRWHVPQEIQRLSSIVTCPREIGVFFAACAGYRIVAGGWTKVLSAVLTISKNAMVLTAPCS